MQDLAYHVGMSLPHEHIASAIESAGFSQNEFARTAGISQASVSLVCSGKRAISPERAYVWAAALRLKGVAMRRFLLMAGVTQFSEALQPEAVKLFITQWHIEDAQPRKSTTDRTAGMY